MNLYDKAIKIAISAHSNQTDKAGVDYIEHPIHVASLFSKPKEKVVALLHDVIEDSEWTDDDLLRNGIPHDIVEAVRIMTKIKGESYQEYLKKVKMNKLSRTVKKADLEHNSDLSRIPNPTQADFERVEKYLEAIEFLK